MRLKKILKFRNMTIKEFCEKTGISKSAFHNYENGKNQPTLDVLLKSAKILNCSLETIVGLDNLEVIDKKMLSAEKQKLLDEILNLDAEDVVKISCFIEGLKSSK